MPDLYAGIPVQRDLFQCANWQRMAENLMAFQDAVQEELGTEDAEDVLAAIGRLKASGPLRIRIRDLVTAGIRNQEMHHRSGTPLLEAVGFSADEARQIVYDAEESS